MKLVRLMDLRGINSNESYPLTVCKEESIAIDDSFDGVGVSSIRSKG